MTSSSPSDDVPSQPYDATTDPHVHQLYTALLNSGADRVTPGQPGQFFVYTRLRWPILKKSVPPATRRVVLAEQIGSGVLRLTVLSPEDRRP